MPTLTYDRTLARYIVSRRHKWLILKKQRGNLSKIEQRELIRLEVKLEEISMEIKSPLDEFTDEEVNEVMEGI